MEAMEQPENTIEVRGFLQLHKFFKDRNWPIPLTLNLDKPLTAAELASQLAIPETEIEIVFVNGLAQALSYTIQPGDRIAFVPPGCPGPYRVFLGFYAKHQTKKN